MWRARCEAPCGAGAGPEITPALARFQRGALDGGCPRGAASVEDRMLTGWRDIEHTLQTFDRLQRRLDRTFYDSVDTGGVHERRRGVRLAWPPTNVYETKEAFVVRAEVPGLTEGDVSVSVEDEALVLRGERKTEVPAGYHVHLRERAPIAFTRKLPLPVRVDADAVTATLKDGVLTVTLPKSRDALPRQIAVKAG
jgi:HSP20 family protein